MRAIETTGTMPANAVNPTGTATGASAGSGLSPAAKARIDEAVRAALLATRSR